MSILYEFTKKSPSFARFAELHARENGLRREKYPEIEEKTMCWFLIN
jgi:hypothetical protein